MVMELISGFSKMDKGILARFQGSERAEAREERPSRKVEATGREHRAAPQDRVEISPKAHRLMALSHAMEFGLQALASLPEVRQDRVAEVRTRLDRGFYNSVEVRNRVAERLDHLARDLEVL